MSGIAIRFEPFGINEFAFVGGRRYIVFESIGYRHDWIEAERWVAYDGAIMSFAYGATREDAVRRLLAGEVVR